MRRTLYLMRRMGDLFLVLLKESYPLPLFFKFSLIDAYQNLLHVNPLRNSRIHIFLDL